MNWVEMDVSEYINCCVCDGEKGVEVIRVIG